LPLIIARKRYGVMLHLESFSSNVTTWTLWQTIYYLMDAGEEFESGLIEVRLRPLCSGPAQLRLYNVTDAIELIPATSGASWSAWATWPLTKVIEVQYKTDGVARNFYGFILEWREA